MDATVGQILAALDHGGLAENTLVFLSSDNGPVWYPADVERLGHDSVGPLRGIKGDAWEGGHRVPFLVRWPGAIAPGVVCDQTICFTDLMATLAEVVGTELPEGAGEDSVSFWPVLRGDVDAPGRGALVLKANASVIRDGRWKLITHLGSGGFSRPRRRQPGPGEPTGQLYDLERDLGETANLWAERPDVVARLIEVLEAYRVR